MLMAPVIVAPVNPGATPTVQTIVAVIALLDVPGGGVICPVVVNPPAKMLHVPPSMSPCGSVAATWKTSVRSGPSETTRSEIVGAPRLVPLVDDEPVSLHAAARPARQS